MIIRKDWIPLKVVRPFKGLRYLRKMKSHNNVWALMECQICLQNMTSYIPNNCVGRSRFALASSHTVGRRHVVLYAYVICQRQWHKKCNLIISGILRALGDYTGAPTLPAVSHYRAPPSVRCPHVCRRNGGGLVIIVLPPDEPTHNNRMAIPRITFASVPHLRRIGNNHQLSRNRIRAGPTTGMLY